MTSGPEPRRAVFLDRDGTVIEERSYLSDPAGVSLTPGAGAALKSLSAAGFALVVVTNQSGIGRGFFTREAYFGVKAEVDRQLAEQGIKLDGTYFCPDDPTAIQEGSCRKPGLVMYRRAAEELNLTLRRSYFVGDRVSDVEPARTLEGTGVMVRTGYGHEQEKDAPEGCHVVDDLVAAASLIRAMEEAEAPVDPPMRPQ